jgi:5-methyltetrahydrofolate--homocysteine methyltransferase
MAVDLVELADAIVRADMEAGTSLTRQGLDSGMAAREIVNNGLIGGMDIIADLWVKEEIFIPEVLLSAKVMHACMGILRPSLEKSNEPPRGVVVIGTVKGDLHDIGQNIVTMMLRGNGFEVHNIGPNSSPEKFAEQAKSVNANLIGLSALLTTTMPMQAETIKFFEENGLLDNMAIMVGGAPVTADWAEKIGADGYGPDAARAVKLAKQLMEDLREEMEA